MQGDNPAITSSHLHWTPCRGVHCLLLGDNGSIGERVGCEKRPDLLQPLQGLALQTLLQHQVREDAPRLHNLVCVRRCDLGGKEGGREGWRKREEGKVGGEGVEGEHM